MFDDGPHQRGPLDEWLVLQPPVWVPWSWWAVLLGSVLASMLGTPAPSCTTAQPCEPDSVFPIVVALVVIAAAAVWWEPATALVAGAGYAALGVLFDPSIPGRYAEAAVGVLALSGLGVLRALRAKQAQLVEPARDRSVATVASTPSPVSARLRGASAAHPAYPLVGVAGLLLAVGSLAAYHAATSQEQEHLDRAQRTPARVVTGTDGGDRQAFELESGPRTGTRLMLAVTDELQVGTERDVLLDPADPSWARLSSEPQGYTFWFGWATLGAFAAGWGALGLGRGVDLAARPALPVTDPLRGTQRWRPIGTGARAASRATGGDARRAVRGRVSPVAARTRGLGRTLGHVLIAGAGCFLMWVGFHQAVPAWAAAHGLGVHGSFAITSVDCGGRGPCHHYGNFRSADGQYAFTDVEVIGNSGEVGSSIPALYEGSGEAPESVYAPGWTGFVESCMFLGLGLSTLAQPLTRVVGAVNRSRGR